MHYMHSKQYTIRSQSMKKRITGQMTELLRPSLVEHSF